MIWVGGFFGGVVFSRFFYALFLVFCLHGACKRVGGVFPRKFFTPHDECQPFFARWDDDGFAPRWVLFSFFCPHDGGVGVFFVHDIWWVVLWCVSALEGGCLFRVLVRGLLYFNSKNSVILIEDAG